MAARKPRKAKAEPEVQAANDAAASQGGAAAAPAPADAPVTAETSEADIMVAIAKDTLRGDLRDALLAYQKHEKNPLPWHMRGEQVQRETIRKADEFAVDLIERMARIVIAGGRETVDVQLEQVVIKDGLKGVITCPATAQNRHLLGDAQGQVVTLAFVSTLPFDGQRGKPKVDKDQKVMFDEETGEIPDPTFPAEIVGDDDTPPAPEKPTDDAKGGGGDTPEGDEPTDA